jgi:hypothetical protein
MLYDSTKSLLRGMVCSLQGAAAVGWEDQIESAGECLYEMHQMARPLYKGHKPEDAGRARPAIPMCDRAVRAIPHVKSMVRAMRDRDQPSAVRSGKAALAEM